MGEFMGRRPTGKPTSFDIAFLAGVSQPTVSRALRGDKSVSALTRARILQIARENKYIVDRNASALRSQRADTVALLFFEDPTDDDSNINPFFLAMLGSITRECANRGLDLLISFQSMDDDWHMRYQDSHRADGLILLGYGDYTAYESKLHKLKEQGTHFVRWGSVNPDNIGPTIGSDNFGAGHMAGAHLQACGVQRAAFLGVADAGYPEFAQRYAGFCEALSAGGITHDQTLRKDALSSEADGYRAARALIDEGAAFDGIFAASDVIAIGAMHALSEAGLRMPDDVAIIGFDDIPAARFTNPALTTVMQDIRGAGAALLDALFAAIHGDGETSVQLPAKLIVRQSTVAVSR